MDTGMRSLHSDDHRYAESYCIFLMKSDEEQCVEQFIEASLPDVVSSFGEGKTAINVLSVGSGSGERDLNMLSKIQARYSGIPINTDIIEPNFEQMRSYKERVSKTRGLENINFTFHEKTASEFELQVKEEKFERKYDFIHMIQMLYFVEDVPATLKFFKSLLASKGKLLIIQISRNSGWCTFWKKYESQLSSSNSCLYISADDITDMLRSEGAKYQCHEFSSEVDITECFIDGNRNGALLLDFITMTCNFNKNAPPELRAEIIQDMKSPEYSSERNGKIMFNNNIGVIVVETE